MMYSYPFSSFPYFRRYSSGSSIYYNRPTFQATQKKSSNYVSKHKLEENPVTDNERSSRTYSGFSFLNNFFNQNDRDNNESYFDLFGLKLYNDDLLLIGLIFFLYKEDVKDQYLFIALILLLLS